MSDSQVESSKALGLARKYDDQGDLANAIKWCKKSISIHSTPEASALLSRLETKGVNGASSSSTSTSTPASASASGANGSAGGTAANGASAARARATGSGGKEKAKEEARAYTPEQAAVVAKIKAAGGDFYKVLSVEKTVEENGIKKAYRKVRRSREAELYGATLPELQLTTHTL